MRSALSDILADGETETLKLAAHAQPHRMETEPLAGAVLPISTTECLLVCYFPSGSQLHEDLLTE